MFVQIQHLLKLNNDIETMKTNIVKSSNTTLVKVKLVNVTIYRLEAIEFKYNTC